MDKLQIMKYESVLLSSNMYIIRVKNQVLIVDPHISKEVIDYLIENDLHIKYIILTHEHYDHISGVNYFKDNFECKVLCSRECAKAIQSPSLNYSKYFDVLMEFFSIKQTSIEKKKIRPYFCTADIEFEGNKTINWQGYKIKLISTPGHSKGSISILVNEEILFSGDALIRDYSTITCLKGGSSILYKEKTMKIFESLNPETKVYPGHFEAFVVKDVFNSVD